MYAEFHAANLRVSHALSETQEDFSPCRGHPGWNFVPLGCCLFFALSGDNFCERRGHWYVGVLGVFVLVFFVFFVFLTISTSLLHFFLCFFKEKVFSLVFVLNFSYAVQTPLLSLLHLFFFFGKCKIFILYPPIKMSFLSCNGAEDIRVSSDNVELFSAALHTLEIHLLMRLHLLCARLQVH